mgnify:CR=1 FL=1
MVTHGALAAGIWRDGLSAMTDEHRIELLEEECARVKRINMALHDEINRVTALVPPEILLPDRAALISGDELTRVKGELMLSRYLHRKASDLLAESRLNTAKFLRGMAALLRTSDNAGEFVGMVDEMNKFADGIDSKEEK